MRLWHAVSPWAKVLLTFGVSGVFAFFFLRDLDLTEVWADLKAADYVLVPFALLLFALSLVARALRWAVFYRPDKPAFRTLFSTLLITYAGNNLLPLRGGEILRIQLLLDRAGLSRMRTIGTAGVERLLDLFLLGALVVFGRFLVDTGPAFLGTGIVVLAGASLGLVIGAYLVAHPGLPARLAAREWPLVSQRWRSRLQGYGESLVTGLSVLGSLRDFRAAMGWTIVAWLLELGMYWLVAEAFHINEGFFTIAFVGASANLALSIPSAQGGVGPFQLVAKEALLRFGVGSAIAAAYAVALHVLLVAPVSIVGLLVLWTTVPGRLSWFKLPFQAGRTGEADVPPRG
jgi:glycosyltransferase 2 family protein